MAYVRLNQVYIRFVMSRAEMYTRLMQEDVAATLPVSEF